MTATNPDVLERLHDLFVGEDAKLQAALHTARARTQHGGVKGQLVEIAVREFLQAHLPRKWQVGTGTAIDRFGARVEQNDVLIMSDDQPFYQDRDTHGTYFIEAVGAVGEVKSQLGHRELRDIVARGRDLRGLRRVFEPTDAAVFTLETPRTFLEGVPTSRSRSSRR